MKLSLDDARAYLANNHRAVFITRRKDGGVQTSLIYVQCDPQGRAELWARRSTAKVFNLKRDPHAALTLLGGDGASRPWMHVEGEAEIVALPDAMDLLDDYHRRRHGKDHEDWAAYHAQMQSEDRTIIRVTLTRAAGA
jgi:PPOX class probable F420-dependent enzyme